MVGDDCWAQRLWLTRAEPGHTGKGGTGRHVMGGEGEHGKEKRGERKEDLAGDLRSKGPKIRVRSYISLG